MIINFQNVYIDNSLSKKVDETEAEELYLVDKNAIDNISLSVI